MLRNALLPTISVIATQTVYLIGGLVVIEILFHYQGIGSLIYTAANKKDFPMLQAGVMVVGALFMLATLARRRALGAAQSAHPRRRTRMSVADPPAGYRRRIGASARFRAITCGRYSDPATFLTGLVIVLFWVFCAIFGPRSCPMIPTPTTC